MATSLRPLPDIFYEPEEVEEIPENATDNSCEGCGGYICLDEDVALTQLVCCYVNETAAIDYLPVMGEDGEPIVRPLFFHFECFEMAGEDVGEAVADVPPIEEPGAILSCDYCKSSIRMGEITATVNLGELIVSPRKKDTTTFASAINPDGRAASPYLLCISCIGHLADTACIAEWSSVSQKGECSGCSKARCWRVGRCACSCHNET